MYRELTKAETKAWTGFIKAQQLLIDKVEEKLKKKHFPSLSWYDVLWELEKSAEGSLRLNDIGKKVLLNKYNVTRLIDRMEKEGLVSREACPIDGRGVFACITPKGRKLRKRMWPVYKKAIEENFVSYFNKNELEQISKLMERINLRQQ